jgi:hypothetical protein
VEAWHHRMKIETRELTPSLWPELHPAHSFHDEWAHACIPHNKSAAYQRPGGEGDRGIHLRYD